MKPSLLSLFPNASQSTVAANPQFKANPPQDLMNQIFGTKSQPKDKNTVQGNVARRRGIMNKTEAEFAMILEHDPKIYDWKFEGVTLKLADGCKFTPDFFIVDSIDPLRVRFAEVKGGHIWDDSKVKFKVAVEQFNWAKWEMWQKKGGQWKQIL